MNFLSMGKIKDLFAKYVSRLHRTEFQGNDNLFTTVDLNREFNHIKNNTEAIEKNFELYSLEVTKTGDTFKISGNAFGFTLKDEPIVTDGTSGTLNDGCFLVFGCREYDNPIEFEEDAKKYVGAKLYGLDKVYSTSTKPSEGLYVQLSVTENNGVYTYKVISLKTRMSKTNEEVSDNTDNIKDLLNKVSALTDEVNKLKSKEVFPIGTIIPVMPYNNKDIDDYHDFGDIEKYKDMLIENGGDWALCDGEIHEGYSTPDLKKNPMVGAGNHLSDVLIGSERAGSATTPIWFDRLNPEDFETSASGKQCYKDFRASSDGSSYHIMSGIKLDLKTTVTKSPAIYTWYIIKVR